MGLMVKDLTDKSQRTTGLLLATRRLDSLYGGSVNLTYKGFNLDIDFVGVYW